ncbi:MAG: glycosyltransferase family 2 protein [Pseudomonadota bacterium]
MEPDHTEPPTPIVILNWNGLSDTIECIDSLASQTCQDFVVHLIDNGSDGNDFLELQERYGKDPKISLFTNPQNLGFTGGVNRALQNILADSPRPRWVVLLNNDTVPDPRWLEMLLDAAESGRSIVGSCMVNYFNANELDNAGHCWLDSGEIIPRGTSENPADYQDPVELIGVCAGAMLIATELLAELGLFDAFFETGYEDAEFGLRAFLAGYPSFYEPRALVRHKISRSVDKVRSREYAMRIQLNINFTYLKLVPLPVALCNAPFLVTKTLGVLLVSSLFGRWALTGAHLRALSETWKARARINSSRVAFASKRRVSAWQILRAQEFFLPRYVSYFRRYILTGRKTVFER